MTRSTIAFLILTSSLLLAGCGKEDSSGVTAAKVDSPAVTTEQPIDASPSPAKPSTATTPEGTPDASKPAPVGATKPPSIGNPPRSPMGERLSNRPKANIQPPATGDPGWRNSSMGVDEFTAKLEKSIGSLKGIVATAASILTTPQGEGRFSSKILIKDKTTYRIDYIVVDGMPYSGSLVSNGERRSARVRDIWITPLSSKTPFATTVSKPLRGQDGVELRTPILSTGDRVAKDWNIEFTRLLFQGLTEGTDAIKPALQGMSKDAKVYVQERDTLFHGKTYLNYRLLVVDEKSKTESQEIIVDSVKFLPITIRTSWADSSKKPYKMLWMCSWSDEAPDEKEFKGPF